MRNVNKIRITKAQAVRAVRTPSKGSGDDVQEDFSTELGTVMTLMVLSALPETNNVDVGLNFTVVGGNSCDFRIVTRGYITDQNLGAF
jgi:hypothetical protein